MRNIGSAVFAGTVIEEGGLTIKVKQSGGNSKYDKIVKMIEESEKLKSGLESKAEHLADSLVPYTLGGTALTYLLTRNATKALSILMVDFSCALKLAMPITVLSAIRQAGQNDITVKGGKFLEAVAAADTIVFDKTGTLTKAAPTVKYVYSFSGDSEDELLRMAACMEEHFPHSMAKAVVDAAAKKNLRHEEMHTKVEYIVAHGISTTINNKKTIIGSYHFVFEDEGCTVPEGRQEMFDNLPEEYSHLYLAIEDKLAAVICIEDPVRPEAKEVISSLKELGISKVVMMTGDSERTAKAIAGKVGVDEYYSEVLPEDKASFVEKEKAAGRKVIMIGDGINDSPALSAADVGIAISDGAQIAREIADITVSADDLGQIVYLKDGKEQTIDLIEDDLVFITNGCCTDTTCYGDQNHAPDLTGLVNGKGDSWDMWKNIAKQAKHGEFGNPDAFCSDIEATNWMSATVATSDEKVIQHIMNICKRDPREGKVTTGGIVTVKDSMDNWYLSWTINRQPQFKSQDPNMVLVWLYALNTNKEGNYVKKAMRNCTGKEVLRMKLRTLHPMPATRRLVSCLI